MLVIIPPVSDGGSHLLFVGIKLHGSQKNNQEATALKAHQCCVLSHWVAGDRRSVYQLWQTCEHWRLCWSGLLELVLDIAWANLWSPTTCKVPSFYPLTQTQSLVSLLKGHLAHEEETWALGREARGDHEENPAEAMHHLQQSLVCQGQGSCKASARDAPPQGGDLCQPQTSAAHGEHSPCQAPGAWKQKPQADTELHLIQGRSGPGTMGKGSRPSPHATKSALTWSWQRLCHWLGHLPKSKGDGGRPAWT